MEGRTGGGEGRRRGKMEGQRGPLLTRALYQRFQHDHKLVSVDTLTASGQCVEWIGRDRQELWSIRTCCHCSLHGFFIVNPVNRLH